MDNLRLLFSAPPLSIQLLLDGILIGAIFALAAYGMALVWGVKTIQLAGDSDENDLAAAAMAAARKILPAGSVVVLLSLGPPGAPHSTSVIRATTL